jgi:catechol 2,3-dioxygenase-like lactoylglutathione lyase family enzyme
MAIRLDHTIVSARDKDASARFLSEILGLAVPTHAGPFAMVQVDDTSFDYVDSDTQEITSQHYAFLVSEREFDEIFGRIRSRGLEYWADPFRRERDRINDWDGGRGVYFDDPNGHLLEIITRSYGTGGTTTSKPHPLLAQAREADASARRDRGRASKS